MAAAGVRSSIGTKLTRSFVFVALVSVLLVCLCFLVFASLQYRDTVAEGIAAEGSILASNSAAALAFEDGESASDLLHGLSENPQILSACLFTADGRELASYLRTPDEACKRLPAGSPKWRWAWQAGELHFYREVRFDGAVLGSLVIRRALSDFRLRVLRMLALAGAVLVLASLASLLLARPMQRFLTTPILHLAEIARHVTLEQEYSVRASKTNDDELGDLTDAFNQMLEQIARRDASLADHQAHLEAKIVERTAELREINEAVVEANAQLEAEIEEREKLTQQLVKASREAGMAEIATGVLHNVGNVLNSVGVSLSFMDEKLRRPRASGLARALDMVEGDDLVPFLTEHPRGDLFLPYLRSLAKSIAVEHEAFREEFERLTSSFHHVKEIVSMQQSYARAGAVAEIVDPADLVEDALAVNRDTLGRDNVTIVREFRDLVPVSVDRHKVLQIVINLVRNSQQAMAACDSANQAESGGREKRLTLRVEVCQDDLLRIEVEDTGEGIAADDLQKVFRHGFTTKPNGHGYGLHASANAAQELHGSLQAKSDGPGMGAIFRLELPIQRVPVTASPQPDLRNR